MHYDFTTLDVEDRFTSVPEGVHLCRVAEVRERTARDGSPRWSLRLDVAEGEYAGRTAGWDSLTWSERGVHRVQLVLCALGVDARGEVEIEPQELLGRRARVRFETEEREDTMTGRRRIQLRVPYAGYAPPEAGEAIDSDGGGGDSAGDGPPLDRDAAEAF